LILNNKFTLKNRIFLFIISLVPTRKASEHPGLKSMKLEIYGG